MAYLNFVDGSFLGADTAFDVINPATGEVAAQAPVAQSADAIAAVADRAYARVGAGPEGHAHRPAKGDRQDGQAVIVDVLADQVDAAWRGDQRGIAAGSARFKGCGEECARVREFAHRTALDHHSDSTGCKSRGGLR